SARAPAACPPAFSICSTVFLAALSLMSTTTTRAPSRAMAMALAAPIPDPAPVTIATRSFKRMEGSFLQRDFGHRADRRHVAGHHDRRDARGFPLGQLFANAGGRAAQRHLVHQRVG